MLCQKEEDRRRLRKKEKRDDWKLETFLVRTCVSLFKRIFLHIYAQKDERRIKTCMPQKRKDCFCWCGMIDTRNDPLENVEANSFSPWRENDGNPTQHSWSNQEGKRKSTPVSQVGISV